jgi:glutamine cyclotransferase
MLLIIFKTVAFSCLLFSFKQLHHLNWDDGVAYEWDTTDLTVSKAYKYILEGFAVVSIS